MTNEQAETIIHRLDTLIQLQAETLAHISGTRAKEEAVRAAQQATERRDEQRRSTSPVSVSTGMRSSTGSVAPHQS